MRHWLVIVARDRPELLAIWCDLYGGDVGVEIRLDRRQGEPWTGRGPRPDRRVHLPRHRGLHEQGFLMIPRPRFTGALL